MKKLMLFIIAFLVFPTYVNAAEPSITAPGFQAAPLDSNAVTVVSEALTIDTDITAGRPEIALVNAKYQLENPENEDIACTIAFPHVYGTLSELEKDKYLQVSVKLNGEPVSYEDKIITDLAVTDPYNHSYTDAISFDNIMKKIDASENANNVTDNDSPDDYSIRAALFEIVLKPHTVNEMEISYYQHAGINQDLFYYDFIFEPAGHWKDFSNLDITIHIPEGYNLKDYSYKLHRESYGHTYKSHYDRLPNNSLSITVFKSRGLKTLWDQLYRGIILPVLKKLLLFIAVTACITVIVIMLIKKRKKRGNTHP